MSRRKIHLIAPAGSCRTFLAQIEAPCPTALLEIVQETVGFDYLVTGDETLIAAEEDEYHGGRDDDQRRAEDIEQALADPQVAALVLVRGGAWFTRILPRIDLSVLDRRTCPVAVFGFSELTTLVNIVGAHPNGLGVYDMGPAFMRYGMQRHAETWLDEEARGGMTPKEWMRAQLRQGLRAFFRDIVSIIEGRGTERPITANLIQGELPDCSEACFVGGNLTVLSTLVGTPFQGCVMPVGRWLVIEDFKEKPERLDRFIAHFTLAGFWNECRGLLLGDFHKDNQALTPAVASLLRFHLPPDRHIPVLTTKQVGHVWPMSPLPLHLPTTLERIEKDVFSIRWPAPLLTTV